MARMAPVFIHAAGAALSLNRGSATRIVTAQEASTRLQVSSKARRRPRPAWLGYMSRAGPRRSTPLRQGVHAPGEVPGAHVAAPASPVPAGGATVGPHVGAPASPAPAGAAAPPRVAAPASPAPVGSAAGAPHIGAPASAALAGVHGAGGGGGVSPPGGSKHR